MDPHKITARRAGYNFLLVFLVLAAGIVASGFFFYGNYKRHYRAEVEHQLSANAQLKADELADWRSGQLATAAIFYKNAAFSTLVRRHFEQPEDRETQSQLRTWLVHIQAASQYERIMLLDTLYSKKMIIPDGPERSTSFVSPSSSEGPGSGKVIFEDFYWNEQNRRIYLKVLVPILDESQGGRVIGILALRIDPETYLYPVISRWPTDSPTAETLLIRRDGNDVLFLNELRFQKNTALKLRIPLTNKKSPAVRAVLGYEGITEGIDYRSVPVLAAVHAVPGSPWFLVARMDLAEFLAPLRERTWVMIVLIGSLLLGAGGGTGIVWRHQRARFYRERYEAAEALRAVSLRLEALLSAVPDIIMEVDKNKVYLWANQAGRIFFGEDVIGKEAAFYFEGEQETHERVKPLFGGDENVIYVESWQRRRDGEKRLLAWWCRVLRDGNGRVTGALSSAHDITELRRVEEALRASEEHYRTLFDEALDGICLADAETGIIIDCNPALAAIVRRERSELIGRPQSILHPPQDDKESFSATFKQHLTEKQGQTLETQVVTKTGNIKEVEIKANYMELRGRKLLQGIFHDITERKQADKEIRKSHSLLTATLESTVDGILVVDRSGKISGHNHIFLEMWHIPESLIVTRDDDKLLQFVLDQLQDPNVFLDKVHHLYQRPDETSMDELLFKDGRVFERYSQPQRTDDTITGRVWSFRDITERKRAEEAVRQSEEKYRGLTENINLGIYRNTVGPEGKFIEANPAIIGMFGHKSKEEFLAINVSDLYLNPEDRNKFNDKMLKDEFVRGEELWLQKKDGSLFVGSVSAVAVKDEQGHVKYYDGIIDNITERKRAEEALRLSNERFELANRATYNVIWDWNLLTNALSWNENFQMMFGYRPDDIEPGIESWTSRIHPEDRSRVETGIHKAIDSGRPTWSDKYGFRRKDGTYAEVDDRGYIARKPDGSPVRMIGAMSDITERERAEAALRKSEERFKAMVENAFEGTAIISKEGVALYVTTVVEKIAGLTTDDVLGTNFIDKVHPDDMDQVVQNMARLVSKPGSAVSSIYRIKFPDGSYHCIESTSTNLIDNPSVGGIVVNFRDITERRQAEILERAVYEIARAPEAANNLDDLYQSVHLIIKGLMPAANYYVALYDEKEDLLSFPYFVDEIDSPPPSGKPGRGLTEYVLRTGCTLLCDAALDKELIRRGEVEMLGVASSCWLGVPLKAGDKTFGVIALQHYSDPKAYGEREKQVLEYVSGQVANAIERKQAEETLLRTEENFRRSLDDSPLGVRIISMEGETLYANQAMVSIYGYDSVDELRSTPIQKRYTPKSYAEFKVRYEQRRRERAYLSEYEVNIVRKSGEIRNLYVLRKEIIWNGEIQYQAIYQDITDRKLTEDKLQKMIIELEKAFGGIIQVLTTTVEKRDPYTAGHEKRVAALALAIGLELGLGEDRLNALGMAGSIHDVGKISIPAEILSKPGQLAPFEFKLIQAHPQIGYDIFKEIDLPWPIADMILQHHERMDGSGYPFGLKDQDILLEARILAVADVVEAMASHRPYRPAQGIDAALNEIEKNRGLLYDSDVGAACLKLFREKGFSFENSDAILVSSEKHPGFFIDSNR